MLLAFRRNKWSCFLLARHIGSFRSHFFLHIPYTSTAFLLFYFSTLTYFSMYLYIRIKYTLILFPQEILLFGYFAFISILSFFFFLCVVLFLLPRLIIRYAVCFFSLSFVFYFSFLRFTAFFW